MTVLYHTVKNVDWILKPVIKSLTDNSLQQPIDKVLLATISRNIKIDCEGAELRSFTPQSEDNLCIVVRDGTFNFPERRNEIFNDLDEIIQVRERVSPKCPTIICMGELDYPIEVLPDNNLTSDELHFRHKLIQYSKNKNCLIVCGSYHDPKTCFNKAVLLSPNCENIIEHSKHRPAHRLGEKIRVPNNNQLRYYKTPIGNVALLICMDIYDLNVVLTLARTTFMADDTGPIDYIIVPSYNDGKSREAAEACKRLSYLTSSTVIYVSWTCHTLMPLRLLI